MVSCCKCVQQGKLILLWSIRAIFCGDLGLKLFVYILIYSMLEMKLMKYITCLQYFPIKNVPSLFIEKLSEIRICVQHIEFRSTTAAFTHLHGNIHIWQVKVKLAGDDLNTVEDHTTFVLTVRRQETFAYVSIAQGGRDDMCYLLIAILLALQSLLWCTDQMSPALTSVTALLVEIIRNKDDTQWQQ